MDIDHVIRGDDLLESTARQLLIMDAIDPGRRPPDYLHVPLIAGPDGLRLAKRHGDSRLSHYRERGVAPEKILQLLARWCGIDQPDQVATLNDILDRFDLSKLDHRPIIFAASDELDLLDSMHRPSCRP